MSSFQRNYFLVFLAILAGAMWQLFLVDDNLGTGWPHNVVRNWEQFGFFHLHGQLVCNPGGSQIDTAPDIYRGMSPVCLWPAFAAAQLFAWTGLGTLAFHLFLAVAVFWAIWALLGRDSFAFLAAAAALVSPGYDRWQMGLDPNAISVLVGLPYAAVLVQLLKKPRLGPAAWIGLFLLTVAFISLNWTTAWVLGPLVLMLLGLPAINRRSLFLYVALAGLASVLFVGISALNKMGGGTAAAGSHGDFLRSYLWGNVGYGEGLTTGKAFGLLAFTNVVGLLALWLVALAAAGFNMRGGRTVLLSLAPLGLALVDIVVMRNYFGHHPWMASPVILAGLVFSLTMLRGRLETAPATGGFKNPAPAGIVGVSLLCLLGLGYGLAVLSFFRANEARTVALVSLIRHHTERTDAIVIVKETDPQLAQMASRFDELFDRHIEVVTTLPEVPAGGHAIVLSSATIASLRQIATGGQPATASFMTKVTNWFNRTIARRKPGDRLELADSYFLYAPHS